MHAHGQLYSIGAEPGLCLLELQARGARLHGHVGLATYGCRLVPYGCRRVVRVSKVAALHNPVPKSVRKVGGMGGAACETMGGALPSVLETEPLSKRSHDINSPGPPHMLNAHV